MRIRNKLTKAVATLLLTLMCFSARAEYDFQVNGLYYRVISLENLTCACVDEHNTSNMHQKSKYKGNIIIPSTVTFRERVFTVIEVAEAAFLKSDITSVRIGGSVKVIGKSAFSCCRELQRVILADGVDVIEPHAFSGCSKLRNVMLSNTLQSIGYSAFDGCNALSCEIVIPPSCKYVGEEALPSSGEYSVRILDGAETLEIYKYGLGFSGGKTLYIGRNLSSGYYYVGVYEYQDVIIGDNVTVMPTCYRYYHDLGRIRTLVIGKNIITVPKIGMFDIGIIRIRRPLPPKAEGFLDKVYTNSILYVPKGSLSEYKKADVWKNFWTIKEDVDADPDGAVD